MSEIDLPQHISTGQTTDPLLAGSGRSDLGSEKVKLFVAYPKHGAPSWTGPPLLPEDAPDGTAMFSSRFMIDPSEI